MVQNALIYCRVSTEEQAREGFSLDAQEKFCRAFAKQNNFRVVETYRDEGKSGSFYPPRRVARSSQVFS